MTELERVRGLADNATGGTWYARYSGGGTHEVLSHCGSDTSVVAERMYEGDAALLSSAKDTARKYADALGEIERLKGVLEWYADACNWNQGIDREGFPQDSGAQEDEGQRARAALASAPEERHE